MEFEDGYQLTEDEVFAAGPIVEAGAAVVAPSRAGREKDLFEWDGQTREGTVKLAVIRPCVSRGKRIKGLPPIYTQEMLGANAPVYSGWLMYLDHASRRLREALEEVLVEPGVRDAVREAVAEAGLAEGSRSVLELGGRILHSWWDGSYTAGWDEERGYRAGAVMAEALPQPVTRAMLEADPGILNVSHNAWPSGGVVGTEYGKKGVIIEGIRKTPEGSVDWVPRGGAGGSIAESDVELAVSSLRSTYASRAMFDLSKAKDAAALIEGLKSEAPALLEELGGEDAVSGLLERRGGEGAVSESRIKVIVREALAEASGDDEDDDETPEEIAERIIRERETSKKLSERACDVIDGAGLGVSWTADLKARYAHLPSGPPAAIRLIEEKAERESKDVDEVLKEALTADLEHAVKLIEESGGTVRVKGLGASRKDPEGEGGAVSKDAKYGSWLNDIGGVKVPEGSKESDLVAEMLSEGVAP